MSTEIFSPMQLDAIGEVMNISLGASATSVSSLLGKRVDITTPQVKVVSPAEFEFGKLEPAVGVEINYVSGLNGSNVMILKRSDVKTIVEILMGMEIPEEEFQLDEMNMSAIREVMNQMMGASSTALAEFLNKPINISTPISFEVSSEDEFKAKYFITPDPMVVVWFTLTIEDKVQSEFLNVMPVEFAQELLTGLGLDSSLVSEVVDAPELRLPEDSVPSSVPEVQATPVAAPEVPQAAPTAPQPVMEPVPVAPPIPQQVAQPVQPQPVQPQPVAVPMNAAMPVFTEPAPKMIQVQPMLHQQFEQNHPALEKEQAENLSLIMGVPLEVSVEIGRTKKRVKDILSFTQGTLVVLDKLAGEQVDLYVNGQCVAKGDVVVVEDYFGVRITEIVKGASVLSQEI